MEVSKLLLFSVLLTLFRIISTQSYNKLVCANTDLDITCPGSSIINGVGVLQDNPNTICGTTSKDQAETIFRDCYGINKCVLRGHTTGPLFLGRTWKLGIRFKCFRNDKDWIQPGRNICIGNITDLKCKNPLLIDIDDVMILNNTNACWTPNENTECIKEEVEDACEDKQRCNAINTNCNIVPNSVIISYTCIDHVDVGDDVFSSLPADENRTKVLSDNDKETPVPPSSNTELAGLGIAAGLLAVILLSVLVVIRLKRTKKMNSIQNNRDQRQANVPATINIQGIYTSLEESRSDSNYIALDTFSPNNPSTNEYNYIDDTIYDRNKVPAESKANEANDAVLGSEYAILDPNETGFNRAEDFKNRMKNDKSSSDTSVLENSLPNVSKDSGNYFVLEPLEIAVRSIDFTDNIQAINIKIQDSKPPKRSQYAVLDPKETGVNRHETNTSIDADLQHNNSKNENEPYLILDPALTGGATISAKSEGINIDSNLDNQLPTLSNQTSDYVKFKHVDDTDHVYSYSVDGVYDTACHKRQTSQNGDYIHSTIYN